MQKLFTVLLFLFLIGGTAYSQSEKKDKNNKASKADRGATYSDEYKGSGLKKDKKKNYNNLDYDTKIKEYEKRMQANAKKQKKIAKEMEKPQYSDPTYFGHKKKPKKRKNGKKKYCKECDLVH